MKYPIIKTSTSPIIRKVVAKIHDNGYRTSSSKDALEEIQKGNLAFFTPTFDFLGNSVTLIKRAAFD